MMIRAMRLPWKVQEIFDRICSCSCVILIFVWGKVMLLHLSVCSQGLRGSASRVCIQRGFELERLYPGEGWRGLPAGGGYAWRGIYIVIHLFISRGSASRGSASSRSASREGSALGGGQTPPPELEKRVVLILLECFLVLMNYYTRRLFEVFLIRFKDS